MWCVAPPAPALLAVFEALYAWPLSWQASSDGVWGEHEIDYILFCRPKTMPRIALNPNEIASIEILTRSEMQRWMATAGDRCVPPRASVPTVPHSMCLPACAARFPSHLPLLAIDCVYRFPGPRSPLLQWQQDLPLVQVHP